MIVCIHEHYNGRENKRIFDFKGELSFERDYFYQYTKKSRNEKLDCFRIFSDKENKTHAIANSYFIGVDWIIEREKAIYVEPKLNKECETQTDYLKMLFSALQHEDVSKHTHDLFEIKWEKPTIKITRQQDLLTPLLIVHFLNMVKNIVRKGLKKSYYKVENNLYSKVKGKVLISQTIKHNLVKNKPLNTYCTYDEFGFNGLENRLLKRALSFIQLYLPHIKNLQTDDYTKEIFNYVNPAFISVSEDVNLNDIKHTKTNTFYKEYSEAIPLAKLIIKRFGYNISNTQQKTIQTPPFWIDMSKLFELYTLGLLKDRFSNDVKYHFKHSDNELDFLLKSADLKLVIDAKYKEYQKYKVDSHDVRQVSGYARLNKVYKYLEKHYPDSIDCLIVYPDIINGYENFKKVDLKKVEVENYQGIYKIGIKLPLIK